MKSATVNHKEGLKITEIFFSLQGESSFVGLPTIFVRLTGCPLRCQYCDTAYAFHGGSRMSIDTIISKIKTYPTRYICITGGEPLAQKQVLILIKQLCDLNYSVSIETSGALSIAEVDQRASRVVDFKTPGSGEMAKNLMGNIDYLTQNDQVKWVICNRQDYEWAKEMLNNYPKLKQVECLMSPSYEQLEAKELAAWILEDGLQVRLQVQLHKILWGDEPGR